MATKTIFITGASSGIGLATAKFFAQKGWNVIATMRNLEKDIELKSFSNIKLYALDVTNSQSIQACFEKVMSDHKKVDVLLNNAGYGAVGIFETATEEQIFQQINTNVLGVMRMTKAILPHFRANKNGTIINLSSVAGRIASPLYSLYNASKYAVEGFSESLAYELKGLNIKVKLIEPGPIKTNFNSTSKVETTSNNIEYYAQFNKAVSAFYNPLFEKGEDVDVVVKTIYKAATSKCYRLRYKAGYGAKTLLFLNKITPSSLFVWMNRRMTGIYKIKG